MSVFRLSTEQHILYPCTEIDGIQITIQNCGLHQTDVLVEVDSPDGLLLRELRNLKTQADYTSLFMLKNISTHGKPFILQIVSNARNKDTLLVLAELIQGSTIIASHTNRDFTIFE
ncbi:hypothetical protein OIN60_17310 [Paenibacillus sp. P96]|uniref:Uncharacterized protein n=1 Tax=Paenibacillus zeirhizosphaerae TaxID=2987519 RepID=A0ABT9FV58_9BACL|nr:hypothetical protein [Paenibacillus sp. P96]MDP4098495.1 hypothetical protein [Paenibacillus sp. P96]